jgi:hypothetical protein
MRDGGLATPASSLLDLSEYDGGSVINTYIVLVLRTFIISSRCFRIGRTIKHR